MKTAAYTIKSLPCYEGHLPENAEGQRRLVIQDIWEAARIFEGPLNYVSYLEFPGNGKILGNHYHERTTEYIYLIKGKIKLHIRKNGNHDHQVNKELLETGHLLCIPPGWSHAYETIENGTLIEFCQIDGDPTIKDVIADIIAVQTPAGQR